MYCLATRKCHSRTNGRPDFATVLIILCDMSVNVNMSKESMHSRLHGSFGALEELGGSN